MNWKAVSIQIGALALAGALFHVYERSKEHDSAQFLRERSEALRAASVVPMHNPPVEREIIALAEKDSSNFCHPVDRKIDGCRLDAVLVDDHWLVFAWPYFGSPGKEYVCCAPDSDRRFIYSRAGVFLREENGGP